jgi:hypothetical protein
MKVNNKDLAKYGVTTYLFFDFMRHLIILFAILTALSIVSVVLNSKGNLNTLN